MIVAVHAGAGKTYFAKTNPATAIDLTCMPYKYLLSDNYNEADGESCKADFDLEMNPEYPDNYFEAIIKANAENPEKFILIPPDPRVLFLLWHKAKIPYIICYPRHSSKNEYRRRYIDRGNSESFLDIFIGGWNRFWKSMRQDTHGRHIIMQPHQFLSDILDKSMLKKDINEIGFDNSADMFIKALSYAIKAHDSQYDKAGEPYILHPLGVSELVEHEDEKVLAILHDIVEDTDFTLENVEAWGFGHLTDALDCLTRRKNETYAEFIRRILPNPLAVTVKIADMKHNISRINNLPEHERGLTDRYNKWLPVLEKQLNEGAN